MKSNQKSPKIRIADIIPEDVQKNILPVTYLLFFPSLLILLPNNFINANGIFIENILLLLLFIITGAIGPKICRKILMAIMITLLVIWNTADIFCFIQLHTQWQPSFFYLLGSTNFSECLGFLQVYLPRFSNLILLLYISGAVWIRFSPEKFKKSTSVLLTILLPFICFSLFSIPPASELRGKNIYDRIDETLDEICFQNLSADQLILANSNLEVSTTEKELTIVLIIGESHSKRHSQIYGYPRETNPLLMKRLAKKELFVFEDVVSPHSFTIYSIPKLLTLAAHDREESFVEMPNIFDLAGSAGFKTFWLSNHPALSDQNAPYAIITQRADEIFHTSPGLQQLPDEVIFPFYDKMLQDPAPLKLIVIQLIGSHHDYESTYPETAEYFPADAKPDFFNSQQKENSAWVNAYDNSIRYNDFILDQLIGRLQKSHSKGFLLYLPDHGENLYEHQDLIMHMEFMPTPASVEIPMYLYLSPNHPKKDIVSTILHRPFASEDMPYLLMDLADLDYQGADMSKSPLSPLFCTKKRFVSRCRTDYETLKQSGN